MFIDNLMLLFAAIGIGGGAFIAAAYVVRYIINKCGGNCQ